MPALAERLPLPAQAALLRAASSLPKRVRRVLAGKPIRLDGQELALDAQMLLRLQRLSGVTLSNSSPEQARAALEDAAAIAAGPTIEPVTTRELTVPTPDRALAARLYSPAALPSPAPLLVFFHGGGWTVGSIGTHDQTARFLAVHAGVRVLSVGYRLAPEHPFPAGVHDALATFDFAHAHAVELDIDPDLIAVGGDSAGGNLSAVVAHQTTRRGGPTPAFQVLIYPAVDFTSRRRSRELFADGFFLTAADMDWFDGHYLAGLDGSDERASVLHAADLSGLPPAYIVTAGFDPLRDDGEQYADALRAAGVPVTLRRQEDLIHGFVTFLGVGARFREATLEVASALRTGLAMSGAHRSDRAATQ